MKEFLIAVSWIMPVLASASPTVLVDSIPTGATFLNVGTVRLPYHDLDNVDSKDVEAGISSAIANAMQFSEPNAVSYMCLLSAAGDSVRSFAIDAGHPRLYLPQIDPSFIMILYRGGRDTTERITYSLKKAESYRKHVTMTLKMVSVPTEWTTAAWVYFNLSKIQDEISKVGATEVFFGVRRVTSPVIVPGLKDPLMVYVDEATISAT